MKTQLQLLQQLLHTHGYTRESIKVSKMLDPQLGTSEEKYHPERIELDPEVVEKLEKEEIGELKGYKVFFINGTELRNHVDPDFLGGSNFSRNRFVPLNELWIEKNTAEEDVVPYILHEQLEAKLMKDEGLSYDEAHSKATEAEIKLRHDPEYRKEVEQEIFGKA